MIDMRENVDLWVCHPELALSKNLRITMIVFEQMDIGTKQGTGETHTVAMTTEDAMWLLKHLQHVQKEFDLPVPEGDPVQEVKDSPQGKH